MKLKFIAASFFSFLLVLCCSSFIFGQDQNKEMTAEEKTWMEYMTPGPEHEMMAKNVGEWKTVTKMWMDPNGEPQMVEGTAKTEALLGGRYFKTTHTGEMMGMPFEGFSLDGYDKIKKEYTSVWVDNMGTGTMVSHGTYDKATKTLKMTGSAIDPMTGKETEYKQTIEFVDDNHQTYKMFTDQNGTEVKMMEVEMTKR